jgi:Uma2 family endonuclease
MDDTVLQPDIVVVCDQSKLDGKCCLGAPDMVVEVVSRYSAGHDKMVKLNKYRNAGVKEYWIVEPDIKALLVCILNDGRYLTRGYGEDESVPVGVLDGCVVELKEVFESV